MVLVLALLACGPKPPPLVCNIPAEIPSGAFFTDVTADWGLSDVRGTTLTTVDIDGDGRPDLHVARGGTHVVNDFEGVRYNTLLRNTGAGFEDVTRSSGITSDRGGGDTRAFQTVIWGDVDNDGDLDAFTGVYHDRNALDTYAGQVHEVLLNDGTGHFELAPPSDVGFPSALAGASFVDFDRDGVLDLWITNFYERYGYYPGEQDRLLRGNGDGTFTDVTDAMGLTMEKGGPNEAWLAGLANRPSYGATVCDVDDDGAPDLLSSVYGRQWNQLWRNDGDGFTDVARDVGFAGDDGLDYDDNQFYRCWCAVNTCDPHPGPPGLSSCNPDYWSPGLDDAPVRLNGNTFTTVCGDIDNDGDMDLYNAEIVHWHIGDSSDRSELLLNDGAGRFSRPGNDAAGMSRERKGAWNEGDIHASFLDVDNDGWKDVLLSSSDYAGTFAWLWRQVSPGRFEEVGETGGLHHPRNVGVAIADFDGDGDLDVILGSSTMRESPWAEPEVHAFQSSLGGNSMRLQLAGVGANAAGIGAKVTVEAGGLTQTFTVDGGYGHRGIQHTTDVHVGLGSACEADRITVRWPDATGTEDVWTAVRGNYTVRLQQGGELAYRLEE